MINVAPDALRKEVVSTLSDIQLQIDDIRRSCMSMERPIEPALLKDHQGSYVMAPLLAAKATCLATLTQLNQPTVRRGR